MSRARESLKSAKEGVNWESFGAKNDRQHQHLNSLLHDSVEKPV